MHSNAHPRTPRTRRLRTAYRGAVATLALAALPALAVTAPPAVPATSAITSAITGATASVRPIPAVTGHILARTGSAGPGTTSQCETTYGIACYSPVQYRVAYHLKPLYNKGITGVGRTIVVVDSYGSPTIQNDLDTFDAQWGLPDTQIQIVKYGAVPPFKPKDQEMDGWANETSLDVEYAHSIAPGAHIVLLETAVSETEGVTGFPQIMAGEKSLINQGIGDVISQSFSATESTFPKFAQGDYSSLLDLRYAYADAAEQAVTVLAAAGDSGATDSQLTGSALYPYRVADWPPSDPLVTAVGGSQLYLDDAGRRLQPDTVWNDGYGAGGGGVSAVFARPGFQDGVSKVVGDHRGYPDISMSGSVNGGAWVYTSFEPSHAGWAIIGGTSESTPIFAGIVALADQQAGHRLGNVNAALYALGEQGQGTGLAPTGIVDVTAGGNSYGGVIGYDAGPGYDLASGWGTIDAARFVPALARL
jgi:subtilase family serine protease